MEGMGTEGSPWRRSFGPVRRMANSETLISGLASSHHGEAGAPALRQPRPSSGLLISKVSLYDVREKDVRVMTRTDPSALTGVAVSAGFVLRSRNFEYVMFAMSTV